MNTMWALYLDDDKETRIHPKHYRRAYTSAQAIEFVKEYGKPYMMRLDHDLGDDDTTMEFLKWMAENSSLDIPYIIHSENPIGRQNITSFIESWKRVNL